MVSRLGAGARSDVRDSVRRDGENLLGLCGCLRFSTRPMAKEPSSEQKISGAIKSRLVLLSPVRLMRRRRRSTGGGAGAGLHAFPTSEDGAETAHSSVQFPGEPAE